MYLCRLYIILKFMSTKKTKNFEKGCQGKKIGKFFLVSMASPFIATRFECCAFEWLRRFYAFGVSMATPFLVLDGLKPVSMFLVV